MARKKRDLGPENDDLNLAPMMNMVMILIPMLALMAVFIKAGVINISSPRNAQATQADPEQEQEEEVVPRVVVSISHDGFRIIDQKNTPGFEQFSAPIDGCPGAGAPAAVAGAPAPGTPHAAAEEMPVTICLRPGTETANWIDQLDFASLYNRLVQIRLNPAWYDAFGEENNSVISLLGDPDVPYEVLVMTMDTARFFLASGASTVGPTADASSYFLSGRLRANAEDLENAEYLVEGDGRVTLFPDPVLLLPRPGSGS